jgi:hypothetical protein
VHAELDPSNGEVAQPVEPFLNQFFCRPLTCPRCHGEMRLIAFLTEPPSIRTILAHLGQPSTPPVLAPRPRAPPELETDWAGTSAFAFDQSPSWDPAAAPPDPGFSFDQTLN